MIESPKETAQVTVSRWLNASPEAVYRAFTRPEALSTWMAPNYELYPDADMVAMEGGSYRIAMRHQHGNVHVVTGTFRHLEPPHRLVFTWQWEGGAMAEIGESLVTVTIEAERGGSHVTLTHTGFPADEAAAEHAKGWTGCLSRLADHLADAPSPTKQLATTLALHTRLYFNTLAGVSDAHLRERINSRTNHMLWMAGHLAHSRCMTAQMLGRELEAPLGLFHEPISDDTDYPGWDQIEPVFRAATAALNEALATLNPEDLAAPHSFPHPIPINDQSLGGMITFLVDHESYHIGQLGFLRKYLGYESMAYSPLTDASVTHHGRFTWFDLMTTDVPGAIAFYGRLVGWGTELWGGDGEASKPPYTMWTNNGKPLGGIMPLPEEVPAGTPPHWLPYIGCADVDATVEQASSLGATIHRAPADIPTVGRFAVIADPLGAVYAAFTPAEEAPGHDGRPQVGEFSWHELMTTDLQKAWSYYADQFGWLAAGTADLGEAGPYRMFGRKGMPLGGMVKSPDDAPWPAAWVLYLHVADIEAALAIVREEGGRVVNGPMEVPGGDLVAQCLDPQGAFFAVHATTAQ